MSTPPASRVSALFEGLRDAVAASHDCLLFLKPNRLQLFGQQSHEVIALSAAGHLAWSRPGPTQLTVVSNHV